MWRVQKATRSLWKRTRTPPSSRHETMTTASDYEKHSSSLPRDCNLPDAALSVRLLGGLSVEVAGEPLPRFRSRSERWLFGLLALRQDQPAERLWLASQLWPESSETQALYNVRRSLSDL